MKITLTAIIEKETDGHVALCPEMDVVSQGDVVDEVCQPVRGRKP